MSVTLATVAEAAAEGKNIVITTAPGIGTVSQTLSNLEAGGLSIAHLDVLVIPLQSLAIFVADGDTLYPLLHNEVLKADVLVFDGIDGASPTALKTITEVMTKRTMQGMKLPSVKSVVAIFTDAADAPALLSAFANTVTIDVR